MNVLQSWYYFGHLEIISDIFLTLGLFMSWSSRVLLGFALILFSGCDNEVDINADWKETIVDTLELVLSKIKLPVPTKNRPTIDANTIKNLPFHNTFKNCFYC